MKWKSVLIVVLLILSSAGYSAGHLPTKKELPKGILPVTNVATPALALTNADGEKFDLVDQQGHWVFVHFWASWCGPCRREIPAIQRLLEKNTGLVFAIVNMAESEDTIFNFIGVIAPDIDVLMDRDGLVTEAWKPRGLPSTYLVDPDGIIRYQALGGRPWDEEKYLQLLAGLVAIK